MLQSTYDEVRRRVKRKITEKIVKYNFIKKINFSVYFILFTFAEIIRGNQYEICLFILELLNTPPPPPHLLTLNRYSW